MKNVFFSLIISAVAATSASQSLAAVPEDCWVTNASSVAGEFYIDLDTSKVTKDELLNTLGQISQNQQIYGMAMPMIAPAQNYIEILVGPNGVTTTYTPDGTVVKESLAHIAARVNPEIVRLTSLPGVSSIRCFRHPVPLPGVTISN